jgi:hypothetical protein
LSSRKCFQKEVGAHLKQFARISARHASRFLQIEDDEFQEN